jgi:hypothetical protein
LGRIERKKSRSSEAFDRREGEFRKFDRIFDAESKLQDSVSD